MDWKDRRIRGWRRFVRSFIYAWSGLYYVVRNEQNMQLHLMAAFIIVILGFVFAIPLLHWLVLIVVIGGMFALEIINTALERVVDLVTEEYHPAAKTAKDLAAASVLVYSLVAVIIGVLIFSRPVLSLLTG